MSKRVAVAAGALFALLACGLFFPFVGHLRARAERAKCQNNLRHIAGLLWLFDGKEIPAGTIVVPGLPPEKRVAWTAHLLKPFGRDDLFRSLDPAAGWEGEANSKARDTPLVQLQCPTARLQRDPSASLTDYVGCGGVGPDAPTLAPDQPRAGAFRYDAPTPATVFLDGTSNTLLLLETSDSPGPWIAGAAPTVRALDPARLPYLGPGCQFGGLHLNGCNVAFADGSFRFMADSVAPDVLELLAGLADR